MTAMRLHVERRGQGRPLLLVHGLGGSVRSWDPIAPALAGTRELVVIDLPGHGRSPALPGRQSVERLVDALVAFIGEHGLEGADLVGSSVGARLVLELTRRGVGGHCVALDPGGFWRGWETPFFHYTLAASIRLLRLLKRALPFLTGRTLTRALLLAQLTARPSSLPPAVALTELQSFVATPVFDAVLRELADGPLQEGTPSPPGRVTIGWGRQDRLLLPRQAQRALAAFPTARLHWFDDCGHFPQWDAPAEAVRVILETCA